MKNDKNWRSRYPIESFDPRFRQVLLEGALKEIIIRFENPGAAKSFQTRLHLYRSQVKHSGDTEWSQLYRARTSRKNNILRVYPADSEFEKAFEQLDLSRENEDAPQVDILDEILGGKKH
jgi:hypothetical protein